MCSLKQEFCFVKKEVKFWKAIWTPDLQKVARSSQLHHDGNEISWQLMNLVVLQRFFFEFCILLNEAKIMGRLPLKLVQQKKGHVMTTVPCGQFWQWLKSLFSLASKPSSHNGIIFHLIFSHLTHSCLGALTVMTHCCDEWQFCFHKCAAKSPPEIGYEPPKKGNLICESVNQSVVTLFFFRWNFHCCASGHPVPKLRTSRVKTGKPGCLESPPLVQKTA